MLDEHCVYELRTQWVQNGCITFLYGRQDFVYVLYPLCICQWSGTGPYISVSDYFAYGSFRERCPLSAYIILFPSTLFWATGQPLVILYMLLNSSAFVLSGSDDTASLYWDSSVSEAWKTFVYVDGGANAIWDAYNLKQQLEINILFEMLNWKPLEVLVDICP